jgi:hypothetical protein
MCRNNILLKVKSPHHSRSLETCLQGADRRITVAKDLLDAMLVSASEESHFKVLVTDADRHDPVERHLVNHLRSKHPDLRPVYLPDFPAMAQWLAKCTPLEVPCDSPDIQSLQFEVNRCLL